jgi:hypothetical protein
MSRTSNLADSGLRGPFERTLPKFHAQEGEAVEGLLRSRTGPGRLNCATADEHKFHLSVLQVVSENLRRGNYCSRDFVQSRSTKDKSTEEE